VRAVDHLAAQHRAQCGRDRAGSRGWRYALCPLSDATAIEHPSWRVSWTWSTPARRLPRPPRRLARLPATDGHFVRLCGEPGRAAVRVSASTIGASTVRTSRVRCGRTTWRTGTKWP
jgi:hypothetical protein